MPLLIAGIVIGLVLFALYRSYASPGVRVFEGGDTYIVIDDGTLCVRRGWVAPQVLEALAETLRDAGISSGNIAISKDNRVVISWHIPPTLHQNIRNILLLHR